MKKSVLLFLSLIASLIVAQNVYKETVTLTSLFLYLFSIFSCIVFFINIQKKLSLKTSILRSKRELMIVLFLIVLQLSLLKHFSSFLFHYMQDEFVLAYTSFFLPSLDKINWFSAFPNKSEWFIQFPIIFFILQKPFLMLLGPSVESIRISTWPYDILIIVYLYLVAKEYFKNSYFSYVVPLVYVFLAPNLYLSSLGLFHASSTFFFMASFYYFLLTMRKQEKKHAVLCGIFTSLSYLTYTSSYIALPLLILFMLIEAVKRQSLKVLKLFIPSAVIIFIVMLPFLTYAVTKNNFFTKRAIQVSFFANLSSQTTESKDIFTKFGTQLATNIKSIYTNEVDGVDRFWVGHQALFNKPTFFLVLFGLLLSLKIFFLKKSVKHFYAPIIILVSFLGAVLTLPPGGFQRTSVAFPFIAILIAETLWFLFRFIYNMNNLKLAFLSLSTILVLFIATNLISAHTMIKNADSITNLHDSIPIASFLKSNVPKGEKVFISAFPAYHLPKELFFRTSGAYTFSTNYLQSTPFIGHNIVILHYPLESELYELQKKFPDSKIVKSVSGIKFGKLNNHAIFIPN